MYGPCGMVLGAGSGVLRVIFVNNTLKQSYVPVDFVNNAIIAAGWNTGVRGVQEPLIYTISSTRRGFTFKRVTDFMKGPKCRSFASPVSLWYCYLIETNNHLVYWLLSWLLHYIPAYIVDTIINGLKIKKPRGFKSLVHLYTKYDKLSAVFSFFVTHEWDLQDSNLQTLWQKLSDTDKTIYNFDVDSIEWEQYVISGCIGGRKYIVKDGLKGTEKAVARQKWLKLANAAVLIGYLAIFWTILRWLWWFVRMML